MENNNGNKLWRAYDENNTLLGTYIPNCLMKRIMNGKYSYTELRIILFICRMSFGFQREETNYLGLEDFVEVTSLFKSHVSKAMRNLLKKKLVLRHSKTANKYKYSVNLLPFRVKMKFYRITVQGSELSREESVIGDYSNEDTFVITYNPNGYNGSENRHRKDGLNPVFEEYEPEDSYSENESLNAFLTSFARGVKKHNSVTTIKRYLEDFLKMPECVKETYMPRVIYGNLLIYKVDGAGNVIENLQNAKKFEIAEQEINFLKRVEEIERGKNNEENQETRIKLD